LAAPRGSRGDRTCVRSPCSAGAPRRNDGRGCALRSQHLSRRRQSEVAAMPAKRRISVAAVFPLIVLGYVLIQLYAVRQAYVGLALPPQSVPILVAWVALMTFALPLVWRLEHRDWHRLATVVAWVGFGWMGWVFLYFWIALGLDVLGLAVSAAGAALRADMAGSAS